MTAPHPPRMTNTRCSSFQLPGFIGSFHGYATFGGAFGSDAYARFCWALNPRESEDVKASLRKAETPDITCIRYVRLFARSNNDPKKKGSRFSRWSIFSNRERSTLFASSSSSENDADDETNNDTDDTDDSIEGRKKTSSFTSFGRETSCDDAFFSRRFAIR